MLLLCKEVQRGHIGKCSRGTFMQEEQVLEAVMGFSQQTVSTHLAKADGRHMLLLWGSIGYLSWSHASSY
jgi:hypothetical protein